jgi:putative SOS response-associated peptidase YedK
MCVNFRPPDPEMLESVMGVIINLHDTGFWERETWKDKVAPIVRLGANGKREVARATYGMVPRKQIPPGVKVFETMNARAETIGEKRSYSAAWRRSQLCLVPMTAFYEPNYETGKPVRWGIGMADQSMFAVCGLWREWEGEKGTERSFTQVTINADDHTLMRRFHKPDDEKRALVIVHKDEWDDWLACTNPEYARSFLRHYPAELMRAWAFPIPPRPKKQEPVTPAPDSQMGLL